MNSTPGGSRFPFLLTAALAVVGIVVIALVVRSRLMFERLVEIEPRPPENRSVATVTPPSPPDAATQKQIEQFCGACHRLPSADQFPRSAWEHEVKRGFQFYTESGRTDLHPPPVQDVVAYYQSLAPEKLIVNSVAPSAKPSPVSFRQARFADVDNQGTPWRSTISAVHWLQRQPDKPGELFCSDMRRGEILQIELGSETLKAKVVAKVPHPAVIRVCDLDGDGQTELVVADLGSFLPEDHELGAVWWFRSTNSEGPLSDGIPIFGGVGRISEVQPLDADGDGDQDLLVAEFGWHRTGGIHLLENQGISEGKLKLTRHLLDQRPGTIHLPVADLNADGQPDFVALISQEHEAVLGFLNDGKLQFKPQQFADQQDPSSGSSGLSLVDLDRDGDLDVLLTYGDSFDSFSIKPAHSVQWLENQGDLKFERHFITPLPGVHRALAGDLDGDGDLDIVAAVFLPKELQEQQPQAEFDSLILLEQTGPGKFERHRLEAGQCQHTSMDMADFDADGDLDLAVSNFTERPTDNLPPVTIWWNLRQNGTVK